MCVCVCVCEWMVFVCVKVCGDTVGVIPWTLLRVRYKTVRTVNI